MRVVDVVRTFRSAGHAGLKACATAAFAALVLARPLAQTPAQPDWKALEAEIMQQFQAVLRFDTRNPPGNEHLVADYLKGVFDKAGIPAQIFALDPNRSNVVARLKGNGRKKPILIMGHSDVVTVDEAKWKFPPFSATRDGGWVYARGTVDDKDNLTAGLMTMLLLKRYNVPLDRDVIFLSEAGEEGASNFGIGYMVSQHYPEIESEYCLAEGGGAIRIGGVAKYTTVETLEKIPRGIELVSHGISGHGSIPLKSNAIVHLAAAVARVGEWRPEIRFNETTGTYFRGLAQIAPPETAKYYRDVLSTDPKVRQAADDWLFENEPLHSSMLRTSVSPNIFAGGYRSNVIPSEAKATLDVRALPDEDPAKFLEQVKKIVNDPSVDVHFTNANMRPSPTVDARLDSEPYKVLEAAATRRLQHRHAADDEHRRHRHVTTARARCAMLWHRRGHRRRGRPQGLRHAQRSGARARERDLSVRALQLRGGPRSGQGEVRCRVPRCRVRGAMLGAVVLTATALGASVVVAHGQQATFSGTNRTVAVYATVTDSTGRLVPDLGRDQFTIADNGKPQELTLFANDIQPITVVMLLDRSTSMRANNGLVEEAAEAFVDVMLPADKARIGSFSDRIQVDPRDFTSDHDELVKILRTELQVDGPTPLWNAVNVGITDLLHQQGRRVVLVFTDGMDAPMNSNQNSSLKSVMKRAEEEDVMVYAIGFAGNNGGGYQGGGGPGGGFGRGGSGGGGFGRGHGGRGYGGVFRAAADAGTAAVAAAGDITPTSRTMGCRRSRRPPAAATSSSRRLTILGARSRASPTNCTISTRSASRRRSSITRCTI